MSKASIITAAYNGEKFITETLDSLLNQSEKDIELIVIDSESTDKTTRIIESHKDKRIKYFSHQNTGSPVAPRNKGLQEAAGVLIGFCDQDDLYYPEKINKQVQAYENSQEREKVGIIICSADLIDEKGNKIGQNPVPRDGYIDHTTAHDLLLSCNFITACSALVPKKILDEVGSLDESLRGVDDYDLWLRVTEKYGILALKEPLCAWRQSDVSLSADKTKQYIETEKIFIKLGDSETERIGHGKNLTRIFLSCVLNKDFVMAKEYCDKAKKFPLSTKINFLIKLFNVSHSFSYYVFVLLRKMGRISL